METCLKGIAEHFPLTEKELRGYSSLGLAYIGDCIYELFVRTMVVTKGNDKANHYHQKTISYVNAAAQTAMMEKIKPLLTDEEKAFSPRKECEISITCKESVQPRLSYRHWI